MLVLSRRIGEKIVINRGDRQVVLTVLEIVSGRVRLGIDAPRNVPVHRSEVLDKDNRNDRRE